MLPKVLLKHWIFNINDTSNIAKAYECGHHTQNILTEISIKKIKQNTKYNNTTSKWFCLYLIFPGIIQPRHFTKNGI
jgi:hypothetical protein